MARVSHQAGFSGVWALIRFAAALAVLAATHPLGSAETAPRAPHPQAFPFRSGLTLQSLGDVNINDGKAAVMAWMNTVAERSGIKVDAHPRTFEHAEEVVREFRDGSLDLINLTADEYVDISRQVAVSGPLGDRFQILHGEEYVVAVHVSSQFDKLESLKGARLAFLNSPRMCLAPKWIEVRLADPAGPRFSQFFGSVLQAKKFSTAVLPVFFRSADACLVTRRGLDLMIELNPQIGRQLRVIETSPRLVTQLSVFRAELDAYVRDQVVETVAVMHATPAGKQLLTVFGATAIEPIPDSALQTVRDLCRQHDEIYKAGPMPSKLADPSASGAGKETP